MPTNLSDQSTGTKCDDSNDFHQPLIFISFVDDIPPMIQILSKTKIFLPFKKMLMILKEEELKKKKEKRSENW